jgi:hypothetical protein
VFRNDVALGYREAVGDPILRVGKRIDVLQADVEAEARTRRLAAERAVDSVLADSFPASDPPSWTLGITRPQPERQGTRDEIPMLEDRRAGLVRETVIDVSRPTYRRTFLKGVLALAGAAGIALLVPFVILLIGLPIALAVRGVVEAASWLLALIIR